MVNVGALDMLLRFLLAMALFSLATVLTGDMRWLALFGFAPLLSAIFRYCPAYHAFHIRTCSQEDARAGAARTHPAFR